ncbi:hypothetical protein V5799_002628 [Amblyomma americanum]|uniref:Uncharacterized protein n=1 Tax=Amblyomma americanum TaxID=6943 RepID=A0AAQ4DB96_AMBAM
MFTRGVLMGKPAATVLADVWTLARVGARVFIPVVPPCEAFAAVTAAKHLLAKCSINLRRIHYAGESINCISHTHQFVRLSATKLQNHKCHVSEDI